MDMALTLVKALTVKTLDLPKYKDEYREALYQVIEAKLAGKEVVQVEAPAPITTDLSASLKASIEAILAAKEAVRV